MARADVDDRRSGGADRLLETAKSSVKLLLSGWAMAADLFAMARRRAQGGYAPARLAALSPKIDVTGP